MRFSQDDDGFLCCLLVSGTLFLVAFAYFSTIFVVNWARRRYIKYINEQRKLNEHLLQLKDE
ncbi:uncharacterized protein CELE_K10G6.9 [Caenorhabditis elegans]|uniref:Uncharacterized protein n=1 Tax=Caenorhabditis elegans TaxID=6239 RepID=E6N0U6_CAEEL|nr:Uncharacterized protein CELE_K10G6.9 [Caenorhabditis elegans]CCD72897.1 Uncharacterized protein CELE_K10G6.9 [Caenorhabditis elegans]|eukprot:NP_001254085.1 Uncharacterized protein CELE_K10G6.9 [Caenorhabditis elegans]